jgi:type VI secretion system protein ImpK
MASDNPFAEPEEERTIIVPRPGGLRRGEAAPVAPPPPPSPYAAPPPPPDIAALQGGGGVPLDLPSAGANPITAAATTLLQLVVRLRAVADHANVDALRDRVIGEVRRFEERLGSAGFAPNQMRAAHYVVCATVDDIILNTPWGSTSVWAHRSLVSTFHNEATGGERFFLLLDNARQNPAGNLPLLELMSVCLSLGFAGRFRLRPQGSNELARIRDELYQTIRNQRPERERDLSPHWRGLGVSHKPLHALIPSWVSLAGAAVVALLVFIGLLFKLNAYSDQAFDLLARLPPAAPVLERAVAAPAPLANPSGLRVFLEPEIRQGLVAVTETNSETIVSIRSQGMFDSASAAVRPELSALLDRIGQALRDEPGDVTVAGHTDNVPIRSGRFPSNWHLSQARAQAVQAVLVSQTGGQRKVEAQGYADTRPVADNATADGRERNRRIEIVIRKKLPITGGS